MKRCHRRLLITAALPLFVLLTMNPDLVAQEQSVNPGINEAFVDPDVDEFKAKFEIESREVYAKREDIVKSLSIQPGMAVADIGAGTGLFTRLFSVETGESGKVFAIDISDTFTDHISKLAADEGLKNIQAIQCEPDSTRLPPSSIDIAFVCDAYHHFEFPSKTLKSIYRALRPDGKLVLIDFKRVDGVSSDWTMNHVRAGQEVFESEIIVAGFKKSADIDDLLEENYMVFFTKE